MRKKKYFIAALGIAVGATLLIKEIRRRKRLKVISNAGYETAHDINYPLKINRLKRKVC